MIALQFLPLARFIRVGLRRQFPQTHRDELAHALRHFFGQLHARDRSTHVGEVFDGDLDSRRISIDAQVLWSSPLIARAGIHEA